MLARLTMQELEPNVDTRVRGRRLRRRIAIGAVLGGGGLVIALGVWALIPVREVPVIVELQPIVVNREAPPPPPPAPAAPPPPPPAPAPEPGGLACPVLDHSPEADLGAKVRIDDLELTAGPGLGLATARDVPHLAIVGEGVVRLSTDDGASFRTVLRRHAVDQIVMDREGTLYARAGSELGVRTTDGRERWHTPKVAACTEDECRDRIAILGDEIVWLHEDQVATSRDHGRTWKRVPTVDQPWDFADAPVLAWRGSLYQIDHYWDHCGVDDSPVWRLSPGRKISHTIFHNYYQADEPVLRASDDSATTWTWRERCGHEDYLPKLVACKKRDADISAMLMAKTLFPVEGVRTLAVYENSLVELCADGARQIYRRWPVDRVDGVDFRGRPLVVIAHGVYRWSTQHGWRRLYQASKPAADTDAGGSVPAGDDRGD